MIGALAMCCVTGAEAASAPTMADFQGHWTVDRVLGSSPGGVTGEKPSRMIGRAVVWNAGALHLRSSDQR